MFYDIFSNIKTNIEKPRSLTRQPLFSINPSSQVCFNSEGKSVGSCLRQVWFDKTGNAEKVNPVSLRGKMAAFSGNWWEDWFINQLKEIHVYEDSNVIATEPSKFVKGLVDVTFTNPITEKIELVEVKTYNGSSWAAAQNIHGTAKIPPKPKLSHLLQAFRYLIIYKEEVEAINICYIDRSCGDWYKHKQFRVTLLEVDDKYHPHIECIHNEELQAHVEFDVSIEGISLAEDKLIEYLSTSEVPPKDYIESYDTSTIIKRYMDGLIPEYIYKKWQKNPDTTPIGDFQCVYCPYYGGSCSSYD